MNTEKHNHNTIDQIILDSIFIMCSYRCSSN